MRYTPHPAPGGDGPQHTCHTGPLCAYWSAPDHSHPEDPGGCPHESCMEQIHENCLACFAEAMDEAEAYAGYPIEREFGYGPPLCPQHGAPMVFGGHYGAPGTGCSWECPAGHSWAQAGGMLFPPEAGAHILTVAEVI